MFVNLSVKDIELNYNSTIHDNNIVIQTQDIVSNLKLMKYLDSKKIYFLESLALSSLELHYQNEIGTLFLEYNNLTIDYNNKTYLNYKDMKYMFANLEVILGYINIAYNTTQLHTDNPNIIDIAHFTTKQYNMVILNFFALKFRNFASYDKVIEETNLFYDINFDFGEYNKELSMTRFMLTHFIRFISTKPDAIPFSNGFGSIIKNLIQRKNTDVTKTLIIEEINSFLSNLSSLYNQTFSLQSVNITESGYIAQNIAVHVYLKAAKEETVRIILEG